jgi:hypothetical protein
LACLPSAVFLFIFLPQKDSWSRLSYRSNSIFFLKNPSINKADLPPKKIHNLLNLNGYFIFFYGRQVLAGLKKAAKCCHLKNISNVCKNAAESWVNREI